MRMCRLVAIAAGRYFVPMSSPECYGNFTLRKLLCESCYARQACREHSSDPDVHEEKPVTTNGVTGLIHVESFDLSLTLYSGQTFRWGRDTDGWWKGIAFGVAFHLKQESDTVRYVASSDVVYTYEGRMAITDFLAWYLRVDERPRIRVP